MTLGSAPVKGSGDAAKLDAATQAQLQAALDSGVYATADRLVYDEVIDPRELRNALLQGLQLSALRQHTGLGLVQRGAISP